VTTFKGQSSNDLDSNATEYFALIAPRALFQEIRILIAPKNHLVSKYRMSDWTQKLFDRAYIKTEGSGLHAQLTRHECRLAIKLLELKPSDQILDLACGHGRHSTELARQGFEHVTGLDSSVVAIEQARASGVDLKAQFVLGDMRNLSFENEFDAVFSFYNSIFYWDDQTHLNIFQGIYRALKPGGRFLIDSHNPFFIVHGRLMQQHRIFGRMLAFRQKLSQLKAWLRCTIRNPKQPKAWHKTIAQFDPKTGIMRGVKHFHTGTEVEIHPLELRMYTFTEVKKLLEQADFEVKSVVSHSGGTFMDNSPRFIVVALKKPILNGS
jgi:SAM-dependent methyltransferase